MFAVYVSRDNRTVQPECALEAGGYSSGNVIREFAEDYSRAQHAAAMADADHRHPERIREFYLQDVSVPRIPAAGSAFAGTDEDTRRMGHIGVTFKLTGMFVVAGLIATFALTAGG